MKKSSFYFVALILGISSQQANALSITFDYSYDGGFFNDPSRRDALVSAGAFFEARLTDNLAAINSAGTNSFKASFSRPDSGAFKSLSNYNVAADTLVIFAGARALSGSTLALGGAGGYSVRGSSSFKALLETRGQGSPTTDFGPWGGSISFNKNTSWHFDSDVSSKENFPLQLDFYSVAIHEIGHVLGLGLANSWYEQISNGTFTGSASVASYGANVDLSSRLDHWATGTTSHVNGISQETSMDPNISANTRKYFTDLDLAVLKDVGWEVTAVPVPAAAYLFTSAVIGLISLRKKVEVV